MFLSPVFNKFNKQQGISIIEILVVIAIITGALGAILGLAAFSLKISIAMRETTQANFFAQEATEAARNYRDNTSWNYDDPGNQYDGLGIVTPGVAYHPEKSGDNPPKWMMIQGEESIGVFTRKIIFENVMRDGSDNIIPSGGTDDPNTKKVTSTVSWQGKKAEIITYFTNWRQ